MMACQSVLNLDKLRIHVIKFDNSWTVAAKCYCREGDSPDQLVRPLILSKW